MARSDAPSTEKGRTYSRSAGGRSLQENSDSVESDRGTRIALFVSLVQHGESVRAAARRSGLSAEQVLQWLEDDTTVMAALEATRPIIERQIRFRLLALAHKAVDAVDEAIEEGDAGAAMALLEGLGLFSEAESAGGRNQAE